MGATLEEVPVGSATGYPKATLLSQSFCSIAVCVDWGWSTVGGDRDKEANK